MPDGTLGTRDMPNRRRALRAFAAMAGVALAIAARRAGAPEGQVVPWQGEVRGAASIGFARAGMAITLNSLAQGYITDFVADMLRNEVFESAVVDLGEFRTLGRHPGGRPWRLGIRSGKVSDTLDRMVELEDTALAVSGGYGTTFEPSGRFHHIFDPHTGASANTVLDVAVIGPRATTANGLSTAICVAGEVRASKLLAAYPRARAILTRLDGTAV